MLSQIVPYEVAISKLSRNIGIQRPTTLKYLRNLEEASLNRQIFTDIDSVGDLQKPDKMLFDNSNPLDSSPDIGTVRETFFCNQLLSDSQKVEYGGWKSGDFRIDNDIIVEMGGRDKDCRQVKKEENAYVAADDIDNATLRKIPPLGLWFLY